MKRHLIEGLGAVALAVALIVTAVILRPDTPTPARPANSAVSLATTAHHDRWIDLKDYCNRDPLGHQGKASVIRRFTNQDDADRVFLRWDENGIQPVTFGYICEIWEIHIYKGGRHWRMAAHIDFR